MPRAVDWIVLPNYLMQICKQSSMARCTIANKFVLMLILFQSTCVRPEADDDVISGRSVLSIGNRRHGRDQVAHLV